MLSYIVPSLSKKELRFYISFAVLGALSAGSYGILHDQITYTIGPSYFLKLKFTQFKAFDFGLPDRAFISIIGFLATWWVGLIIGWVLARVSWMSTDLNLAKRKAGYALLFVIGFASLVGIASWATAVFTESDAALQHWRSAFTKLTVDEVSEFRVVGFIHNGGYLGAVLGTVLATTSVIFINNKKKDRIDP